MKYVAFTAHTCRHKLLAHTRGYVHCNYIEASRECARYILVETTDLHMVCLSVCIHFSPSWVAHKSESAHGHWELPYVQTEEGLCIIHRDLKVSVWVFCLFVCCRKREGEWLPHAICAWIVCVWWVCVEASSERTDPVKKYSDGTEFGAEFLCIC